MFPGKKSLELDQVKTIRNDRQSLQPMLGLTHLAKHEKVKSFSPSPGVINHPDVALVVAAATVVEKSHQSSAPTSGTLRLPPDVALKKVTALQKLTAEAKIEITLLRRRGIGKLGNISRGLVISGFLGGHSAGCTCSWRDGVAPNSF